ncbi:Peptidase M14, carboxypeptidase A [Candidatus Sulfopaludibacter sp. SbA4]|nr:Peptidase M14, carboxypeptidase A [Candidatus Sulfopaludibacter sp. SbA4]
MLSLLLIAAWAAAAQPAAVAQTTPQQALGFNLGDDYHVANYTQLEAYWKKLASESDRMKLEDIGLTAEGRHQYMAVITSSANQKKLDHYKEIAKRLALAEGVTEDQAHAMAREGKAVIFMDGGLHASETVGSQALMELVYQMVSRRDEETLRFLDDDILLLCLANPDGQELVANWYMREPDETRRSLNGVPRLWQKYVGHDNARDMFMSNQPETANINRVLFIDWFPQITHTHHQTGPAGAVVFMPPFRDPFNYNFDPLMPVGVDLVGAAMHSRLIAKSMPGSAMRGASNYSTWWNGGMRTISYFHNMIGLLTEIIGNPTPMEVPLVLERQLPSGNEPLPIAPQVWHYRRSIDYEMEYSRAVLDVASRYRETFLFNIWRMGQNSIERGSRDNWTVTPKRIAAAGDAAAKAPGRRGTQAAAAGDSPAAGRGAAIVPSEIYNTVLHDPKFRDPRGYILPADQADFPTAVQFINVLLKNGIAILQATAPFQVAGKNYPANSYVVKAAQAARPFVMDMFEPQDHPNDFKYPGGPPNPPYDITGWTLAYQMGIQFDRILDGFDGPFMKVNILQKPPAGAIFGPSNPAGYLISHRLNNSFIVVNRLLKAGCDVYWLKGGTIWVSRGTGITACVPILDRATKELGVPVEAVAKAPAGQALKLKPIRIGLYDQYGGLIPSGWTRWLFEQFEFPFEVVYPQTLDAGDLKSRFDVLVFTDGAAPGGRGGGRGGGQPNPETIPAEYRGWLGRITAEKTIPQLKKFVESGGSIVTIGSATSMAASLGLPVKPYLNLPQDKFYIPGSILRASIDNTNPLAYGMATTAYVDFDSSPVFRLESNDNRTVAVAKFSGPDVLASGWAWGQQNLDGGAAIVEGSIGEGKVFVFGPEVAFRGQPHGTFKLLFNGLYYGSAKETPVR